MRRARLAEFLSLVKRWLKPGGTFAFIDEAPGPDYTPTVDERQARRAADGREFLITKGLSLAGRVDGSPDGCGLH